MDQQPKQENPDLPDIKEGERFLEQLNHYQGYLLSKLPKHLMDELDAIDKKARSDVHDFPHYEHLLIGNLAKEWGVTHSPAMQEFLCDLCEHLDNATRRVAKLQNSFLDRDHFLKPHFKSNWVNYQRKHDFNPPHRHSGAYSYVIWHTIPYDLKEEKKLYQVDWAENHTAAFAFLYDAGDQIAERILNIEKKHEGYVAVFPADLLHYVTPFYTTDDYRVSFSGNLVFKATSVDNHTSKELYQNDT